MIRRAPRPTSGFLLIRNDVLRDERLSYRARGLMASMLTYPDDWEFDRDWLASKSSREGTDAIRTALRELETAGYLHRRRIQVEKGRFGWHWVLYDTPQDVSAGRSIGGLATDGKPSDGNPPSTEGLLRTTVDEDEVNCLGFGRFAPSAAGDIETQDQATFEDWRTEDRALFKSIIGDALDTDGSLWKPAGRHAADVWYDAFRKQKKPIKWPGRYFEQLADTNGVDEWLASRGLETAA